jgi:hypothetical protein
MSVAVLLSLHITDLLLSWLFCRRTVKNIPKYASAQFYIDNVLPRIKEKKIMSLKPFVDRLGYANCLCCFELDFCIEIH